MGLSIHWTLASRARSPAEARRMVEHLRQRALQLPFSKVSEILEFGNCPGQKDPSYWLWRQAHQTIERTIQGTKVPLRIPPTHLIAFVTDPGPGCEPANFGLCSYPSHFEFEEPEQYFVGQGLIRPRRRLETNLPGWQWSSSCKTQYASNPKYGGPENFLRCHLAIIQLLDFAQELRLLQQICDEANYWDRRDVQSLAQTVGDWNERIAALVGQLLDQPGAEVEAPITEFPDFEHLEARGRRKEE